MASPPPAADPSETEGEGLLETIGTQLATLAAQVSDINERMVSVETGTASRPVEVQLSNETIAQIADALAALQAAGSQALDEAFKTASDDLTDALSGLVKAEVTKTLSDAGYHVEVTEMAAPHIGDVQTAVDDDAGSDGAAIPSIVAPLAAGASSADAHGMHGADDDEDHVVTEDGVPLTLDELDDPFLDALIRKEPLSA